MHNPEGERYGMLLVIGYSGRAYKNRDKFAIFKCDCGSTVERNYAAIKRDTGSRSCGCNRYKHSHGMSGTLIYKVWSSMHSRCSNPKDTAYKNYGGRGIAVSKAWHKFEDFYRDMGEANGLLLDRKNNDRGYSKANCRWVTRTESNRNTRTTIKVTYKGKKMCLAEAVILSGTVSYKTAFERFSRGEKSSSIFQPVLGRRKWEVETADGIRKSLHQACKEFNMNYNATRLALLAKQPINNFTLVRKSICPV